MTEQKYRGGRKPYSPTPDHRKQVEAMASYGIPQDDIANVIKISGNTLRKYFRDELDIAETKANAMVAQNLFRQATKDDPRSIPAAIFWAKTRMKWKETVVNENVGKVEVSGPNGGPIETADVSDRERAKALLAVFTRAEAEKSSTRDALSKGITPAGEQ